MSNFSTEEFPLDKDALLDLIKTTASKVQEKAQSYVPKKVQEVKAKTKANIYKPFNAVPTDFKGSKKAKEEKATLVSKFDLTSLATLWGCDGTKKDKVNAFLYYMGWSSGELANMAGVKPSDVYNFKSGTSGYKVNAKIKHAISNALFAKHGALTPTAEEKLAKVDPEAAAADKTWDEADAKPDAFIEEKVKIPKSMKECGGKWNQYWSLSFDFQEFYKLGFKYDDIFDLTEDGAGFYHTSESISFYAAMDKLLWKKHHPNQGLPANLPGWSEIPINLAKSPPEEPLDVLYKVPVYCKPDSKIQYFGTINNLIKLGLADIFEVCAYLGKNLDDKWSILTEYATQEMVVFFINEKKEVWKKIKAPIMVGHNLKQEEAKPIPAVKPEEYLSINYQIPLYNHAYSLLAVLKELDSMKMLPKVKSDIKDKATAFCMKSLLKMISQVIDVDNE